VYLLCDVEVDIPPPNGRLENAQHEDIVKDIITANCSRVANQNAMVETHKKRDGRGQRLKDKTERWFLS